MWHYKTVAAPNPSNFQPSFHHILYGLLNRLCHQELFLSQQPIVYLLQFEFIQYLNLLCALFYMVHGEEHILVWLYLLFYRFGLVFSIKALVMFLPSLFYSFFSIARYKISFKTKLSFTGSVNLRYYFFIMLINKHLSHCFLWFNLHLFFLQGK